MAHFETLTGATHWASYFINGDASGLDPHDIAQADAWRERNGVVNVVSCDEDSERFTWAYQVHCPDASAMGGNVCDYVCELRT